MNLNRLEPGEIATISDVKAENAWKQRLQALGFRTGKQVQMIRHSCWQGPIHVRIGTTEVMLRRKQAEEIIITNVIAG